MLTYTTLVLPPVPITQSGSGNDAVPDGSPRQWSPITSTLLIGERDAVLVDPGMTLPQGRAVASWAAASGKRLTAIYATHGHGDHWFGSAAVHELFPDATLFATEAAIEKMRDQGSHAYRDWWDQQFPRLIGDTGMQAQPVGSSVELEGHHLVPVDVGHTDTDGTTVLHVADLGLVVAGDVVYANLHQSLREGRDGGLESWLAALDVVDSLSPSHVVCGHKDVRLDDDPQHVEETRRYLTDALDLLTEDLTPRGFYDEMSRRHPTRLNPGALWSSANALFPVDGRPA